MYQYRQQAFSLAELLVTLLVLGILLSVASPALSTLIQNNKQTTQINQMVSLINFARTEAVNRQSMVSLCSGEASCHDSGPWREQVLVFADLDHDGELGITDILLRAEPLDSGQRWQWTNFRNQKHLSFKPDGMTHSLNGTFTLCQDTTAIRSIVLNTAGRARLGTASARACTP